MAAFTWWKKSKVFVICSAATAHGVHKENFKINLIENLIVLNLTEKGATSVHDICYSLYTAVQIKLESQYPQFV